MEEVAAEPAVLSRECRWSGAATLLAFVPTLEATAQDDVLDLFDIVVTALFTDAARVGKKARPRTIRRQSPSGPLSGEIAGVLHPHTD